MKNKINHLYFNDEYFDLVNAELTYLLKEFYPNRDIDDFIIRPNALNIAYLEIFLYFKNEKP